MEEIDRLVTHFINIEINMKMSSERRECSRDSLRQLHRLI